MRASHGNAFTLFDNLMKGGYLHKIREHKSTSNTTRDPSRAGYATAIESHRAPRTLFESPIR